MLIEIKERYRRLIHKLEIKNCNTYKIYELDDRYYINVEDLLEALDDTQDNREYAEERLQEFVNEAEDTNEDETPGLLKSYQKECLRLKEENMELQTKIERIQSTLAEDDYDKLAMEGIELDG